jgi:hypothetical protein
MTVVAVPGARARAAITASPRDDEAQATGSGNWTIAPCGSLGAVHSRPPCAPMIERLIDSRMPMPPGFVVRNALSTRSRSLARMPTPASCTATRTNVVVVTLRPDDERPRPAGHRRHGLDGVHRDVEHTRRERPEAADVEWSLVARITESASNVAFLFDVGVPGPKRKLTKQRPPKIATFFRKFASCPCSSGPVGRPESMCDQSRGSEKECKKECGEAFVPRGRSILIAYHDLLSLAAIKCVTTGGVPALWKRRTPSWTVRSPTVMRVCWRRCSSQDSTTNVST